MTERNHIQHLALKLVQEYGCLSFKIETESEGASFEEIGFYNEQFGHIAPVMVKIGGANARNDLRQCSRLGIKHFVAPLVESGFATSQFADAVLEIVGEESFTAINVESISAVRNLEEILEVAIPRKIKQITIGRSDLSASLGKTVEDQEILSLCINVRKRAKRSGIIVAVGGNVTPQSDRELDYICPDKYETRNVVFSYDIFRNKHNAILTALSFEMAWLKEVGKRGFRSSAYVETRLKVLETRMKTATRSDNKYQIRELRERSS